MAEQSSLSTSHALVGDLVAASVSAALVAPLVAAIDR